MLTEAISAGPPAGRSFVPIVWVPMTSVPLQADVTETSNRNKNRHQYHLMQNDEQGHLLPVIPEPITEVLNAIMMQQNQRNTASIRRNLPSNIPSWFLHYIRWHNHKRLLFPDTELLTNPKAPKVWIYNHCHRTSAGLSDRFKYFYHVVYTSYREERVLLVQWPPSVSSSSSNLTSDYNNYKHQTDDAEWSLEYFLRPNLINWTVPIISKSNNNAWNSSDWDKIAKLADDIRTFCGTREGYFIRVRSFRAEVFTTYHFNERIVISKNDEYTYGNSSGGVPFWIVWHSFFLPSHRLQSRLMTIMEELSLQPGHYDAVHCRVRHPAHYQTRYSVPEDLEGLNYTGEKRELALKAAVRAIQCAKWVSNKTTNNMEIPLGRKIEKMLPEATREEPSAPRVSDGTNTLPLYFFSDSEHLVHSVLDASSSSSSGTSSEGRGWNGTVTSEEMNVMGTEMKLKNAVEQHSNVVGIRWKHPLRHVNDGGEGSMESYLSSFVDLYIASGARCIVWGIGQFAVLARQISGTNCSVVYPVLRPPIIRQWGMSRAWASAQTCPTDLEESALGCYQHKSRTAFTLQTPSVCKAKAL